MKKLYAVVSLILALMLGMSCMMTASADEVEFIDFEPSLCNIFEMSAAEWMSSDTYRALATVCIWLDIATSEGFDEDVKIFQTSYIGSAGEVITVALQLEDTSKCIIALFTPASGTGSYAIYPIYTTFDTQVKDTVQQVSVAGFYTNSYTAISDVIDMLSEALSD